MFLPVIRAKLCADSLFADEYAFLSLLEEQGDPPSADQYCVLVLGRQVPDQPAIAGGGNDSPLMNGELQTVVWVRFDVDQQNRSDALLTDATLGALRLVRKVIVSLQLYDPTNDDGDYYLLEPLRLGNGGWTPRPVRARAGWVGVAVNWSYSYWLDLTN